MNLPTDYINPDERRNAVRVATPKGYKLSFKNGRFKLPCVDISVGGVGLEYNDLLPTRIGEVAAFVLDQNDQVIGEVKARLVYGLNGRSGWQFTAMDKNVQDFIEKLVLDLQKSERRSAASKRMAEDEKKLLGSQDT